MNTKYILALIVIIFFIPIKNYAKKYPASILANVVAIDGWEYEDENVSVKYSIGMFNYVASASFPKLIIEVENKSSDFIYLDLGKSFIIRNGNAEPFWRDTKTSYTDGGNKNVNVNVGTITNILGIGGVVGELANGMSIGGGNSSYSTTTESLPRVEPLPPLSKKEIKIHLYKDGCFGNKILKQEDGFVGGIRMIYSKDAILTNIYVPIGETFDYNMNDSPISFSGLINYSLEESCESSKNVINKFYVNKFIGLRYLVDTSKFHEEIESHGYLVDTSKIIEIESNEYKWGVNHNVFYLYYKKK